MANESNPTTKRYLPSELAALARTDVDLMRAVFNPACAGKHERCSYDIQTCQACLDYSAKAQSQPPKEIPIGTIKKEGKDPNVFKL